MSDPANLSRRLSLRRSLWATGLLVFGVVPAGLWTFGKLPSQSSTWSLLPPRRVGWKMKPLSSARTEERILPDGRVVLNVEHELLSGVTPEMLVWWWRNIDGDIEIDGQAVRRYLVWHPIDHIHFGLLQRSSDGSVGPGAIFHLVEALGADMNHLIDVAVRLKELDETGATVELHALGRVVWHMRGQFLRRDRGTQFISTMTIGGTGWLASLGLTGLLVDRFFPRERRRLWLKHSVEEIGNLQFFLPDLYRRRVAG